MKDKRNRFLVHDFSSNEFLVVSPPSNWTVLNKNEMDALRWNNLKNNKTLFSKLEKEGIVVTNRNVKRLVKDTEISLSHLCNGISLHIINPTKRCNLSCVYCYAESPSANGKEFDMDEETAKEVIDFIFQSSAKNIVIEFQGGEPLANFPIIEFIVGEIRKRKSKKVHFRIVSNFTLMDDTIAKFLKRNNVNDLCTSLDGPKEIHDKNRKYAIGVGSYNKVVYWIERLREEYKFDSIKALSTVTKYSLPFPEEIVDEYLEREFSDITPVVLRNTGIARENWKEIGYFAEEYIDFWKKILDYCISLNKKGRSMCEMYSKMILDKIYGPTLQTHTCFAKPCGAALMQASYQYNGDIYTCDEGKAFELFKLGNVKENTYRQIYCSPNALNIIALSSTLGFDCNNCVWNAFCSFCPVTAYAGQGNIISKLPLDFDCKIKKAQISHIFEKLLFSKDAKVLKRWVGRN